MSLPACQQRGSRRVAGAPTLAGTMQASTLMWVARELAHVADVTARTSSRHNWPWCFSLHDVIQRSCVQPGYPAGLRASQTIRLVRTVRSSRADRAAVRASSSAMSPALSLSSRPCRARQRVTMA